MKEDRCSRRSFVRRGLVLAGVSSFLGGIRISSAADNPAEASPTTPEEALNELKAGNQRYVTGKNMHRDFGPERAALALSQRPFAIILGCADSRVAPEFAFDQSRGRLFVVRLAGNFVDTNGLASIEFGASVLGASLVVVLGHTGCGAIKSAVDVVTKGATLPGHLPELMNYLKEPVEKVRSEPGDIVANATRQNVVSNVQKLQTAEPILAGLVKAGRLGVVGGIYDLTTGQVEILG